MVPTKIGGTWWTTNCYSAGLETTTAASLLPPLEKSTSANTNTQMPLQKQIELVQQFLDLFLKNTSFS